MKEGRKEGRGRGLRKVTLLKGLRRRNTLRGNGREWKEDKDITLG